MANLKCWQRLPLRMKLTAWYVFLLALFLGGFTGYLYLRLERKLITKVDTALQIAGYQSLVHLSKTNNTLAFQHTPSLKITAERLTQVGFAVRLITLQGKVVDGFGRYQEVIPWVPTASGYTTLVVNKADWRLLSQPVIRNGKIVGWLQAAQPLEALEEISQELPREILFNLPIVLFLTAMGGLFLANRALRPIQQITQTAQTISATDLTQRLNYRGAEDEVGQLATTFDQMLNRLQAAFEREQRFTADAAHELRTPLAVIKGRIGVTRSRSRSSEEYEKTLQDLEQEVDRLIRMSNGLLLLARIDRGQLPFNASAVDLNSLLEVIIEQVQLLAVREITLVHDVTPELWVQGDQDHLTSLFLNLLDNAVKYTPEAGLVRVQAVQQDGVVQVMVSNTGAGISPEHIPHLFERFYRVELTCKGKIGSGLGLAIAYEITRLHGGNLAVQSEPGKETIFTVTLPSL